jgi:hypothetical protein
MIVLGIAPKAGIGSIRRFGVKEAVGCLTPYQIAFFISDFQCLRSLYKASLGKFPFLFIGKIQLAVNLLVCRCRIGRCGGRLAPGKRRKKSH